LQGVVIKVYEINTWNYYTTEGAEVDLDLELAGVAPTKTFTLNTPDDPMIRCGPLRLGLIAWAPPWKK